MLFNKQSDWTLQDWWNSKACNILSNIPCEYTDAEWISETNMTDEEKELNPSYKTTGGYLKTVKREADRQAWWDALPDDEKETVKALPNFDAEIFYQCTGVRV